jgi:hypothetical protein
VQAPRLDRQLERTERLMRYEFLIQKTNNVIMPRAADESGTGWNEEQQNQKGRG